MNRRCRLKGFAIQELVLLDKKIHCKMNTTELTPGNGKIPGITRPGTQANGVKPALKVAIGDVFPHPDAHFKINSFRLHEPDTPLNHPLLQLELWNPVSQDSTGTDRAVINHHVISCMVKGISHRQSCRPGTYDRHTLITPIGGYP